MFFVVVQEASLCELLHSVSCRLICQAKELVQMSGFQTFLTKEFSFERAVTRELVLLCRSREGVWSLVGQSEVPAEAEGRPRAL